MWECLSTTGFGWWEGATSADDGRALALRCGSGAGATTETYRVTRDAERKRLTLERTSAEARGCAALNHVVTVAAEPQDGATVVSWRTAITDPTSDTVARGLELLADQALAGLNRDVESTLRSPVGAALSYSEMRAAHAY